jgi:hypothetical protein
MRRYTGQKALYEAIAKTKAKSQRRSILELLHPANAKAQQAEPAPAPSGVEEPVDAAAEAKPAVEPVKSRAEAAPPRVEPTKGPESKPAVHKAPPADKPAEVAEQVNPQPRPVQRWLRPKSVQVHDGRVEVSMPYTVGVTILLVAVLLVLGAFRLGQRWSAAPVAPARPVAQPMGRAALPPVSRDVARAEPSAPEASPSGGAAATASAPQGDHVIVLAQYSKYDDLVPVQEYFQQNGIATEVLAVQKLRDYLMSQGINASGLDDGGYILVTADYYNNPQTQGTDGYAARMKIVELGRNYKAPPGKESFAPRYFSDAYGRKVR